MQRTPLKSPLIPLFKLNMSHMSGGWAQGENVRRMQLRPWHYVFKCHSILLHPTPTLALPLKGREIAMLLPLQGGGKEGDGVSVGVGLVPNNPT